MGRIRGQDDQLFIVAVDPTTRRERWRAGPYGTYSEGYRATWFAVVGSNVVVTDFHSIVHVLDLTSGKDQRSAHLTDHAAQLCPLPENKQVFVHQVDKRDVTVDLTTAAAHESPRPAACTEEIFDPSRRSHGTVPLSAAPKVNGFAAKRVLSEGNLAIAAGVKSPGTEIPIAVGFDPKTHAVLWQEVVPAVDPATVRSSEAFFLGSKADGLAAGRYASVYGVGSDAFRLTAFDAKTGSRLWDVELKKILGVDRPNDVVLSGSCVYVTRSTSLEFFEVKTGKALGAYGTEN
jgi:outer membrane protein assembly factor BamB